MDKKKIKPYYECKDNKEFWSQKYGRPVADEEVREIKDNFMRLIELLIEIDREKKDGQMGCVFWSLT